MIQRIHGLYKGQADTLQDPFNADAFRDVAHHGLSRTGMGLMARHCSGGIIQDNESDFRPVVQRVDDARNR